MRVTPNRSSLNLACRLGFSLLISLLPAAGFGQPGERTLLVAVAPCPPIVMEENGELGGLGIFLWNRVAAELGARYEFKRTSLDTMLQNIGNPEDDRRADVGISCVSITAERERVVDFSHSFYETYTGIAVRQHGVFDSVTRLVTNPAIWRALGFVVFVAIVVGGAFYLLESRLSPKLYSMQTPMGRAVEAFIVGILSVTRGPIRFYEFQTLSARVLAAVLALSSTFVIAGITAVLASAFTLDSLSSRVSGLQDLHNVRVAALEGSTSSNFLRLNGIAHRTLPDLPAMMEALANDQLDAVVADGAYLKYAIHEGRKQGEYTSLSVLPYELQTQNYGFAMQDHSELTEDLNLALLVVRQSDEWHAALKSYLGN